MSDDDRPSGEIVLGEWPVGSYRKFSEAFKDGAVVIIGGAAHMLREDGEHVISMHNGSEIVFAAPPMLEVMPMPDPRELVPNIERHMAEFDQHHAPRNRKERRALKSKR